MPNPSQRWRRYLIPIPYLMLVGAVVFLLREFRGVDAAELWGQIHERTFGQIFLSILLLALNATALTFYDALGLRQLGIRLPLQSVAWVATSSTAISNVLGNPALTGTAFRLRGYSRHGISALNTALIMAQNTEIWWLGTFFVNGLGFTFWPPSIPFASWVATRTLYLGILLLAVVFSYLIACIFMAGRSLQFGTTKFRLPNPTVGALKILVAALDMTAAASVFYQLLPANMQVPFKPFVVYFLCSQFLGVLSMIPASVGILEGAMLQFLQPYGAPSAILSTLLLYRAVAYLLPVSLVLMIEAWDLGGNILRQTRGHKAKPPADQK